MKTELKNPACTYCGSRNSASAKVFMAILGFGGGGCLFFLFLILFFPLAPVVLILGILVGIVGMFAPSTQRYCNNCKKVFTVK